MPVADSAAPGDAAERYERQLTQADLGLVGYPFAAYAPAPFPPTRPLDRGELTRNGLRFVGISPGFVPWEASQRDFARFCREFDRRYGPRSGRYPYDDGYRRVQPPEGVYRSGRPHARYTDPAGLFDYVSREPGELGEYPEVPEAPNGAVYVARRAPTADDAALARYCRGRRATHEDRNAFRTWYLFPNPAGRGWCMVREADLANVTNERGEAGLWVAQGRGELRAPYWSPLPCSACGTTEWPARMVGAGPGVQSVPLCDGCAARRCGCGRMTGSYPHDNGHLCTSCAAPMGLVYCRSCARYATDGHHHCATCGRSSDSDLCQCGHARIRHYTDRAAGTLPPLGKGPLWFGIELEQEVDRFQAESLVAGNALRCLGTDYAVVKSDGSICHGFELVTARATLSEHRARLTSAGAWWKCTDNHPSCGMHVHVSRAALTQLQLGKMLVLVNEPSNQLFVESVAGRNSEQYARIQKKKATDIKRSRDRYQALNLVNSATVEFRIFAGSTIPGVIMGRLEWVDAVVAYCAVASLRALGWRAFVDWALAQPDARKRWPCLVPWLESYGRSRATLSGHPIRGRDDEDEDEDEEEDEDEDEEEDEDEDEDEY